MLKGELDGEAVNRRGLIRHGRRPVGSPVLSEQFARLFELLLQELMQRPLIPFRLPGMNGYHQLVNHIYAGFIRILSADHVERLGIKYTVIRHVLQQRLIPQVGLLVQHLFLHEPL
ncbi:hypothetical protein D1872_199340 [compost metagenome]